MTSGLISRFHRLMASLVLASSMVVAAQGQQLRHPQPGEVFRDFTRVNTGDTWRVTDPNATAPGASAFLPNPVNSLTVADLQGATRAEFIIDFWGGHAGTQPRRFRFNGNAWIDVPLLQTGAGTSPNCFNQQVNFVVDVPLSHVVEGVNTFEGTAGGQTCANFNWGQWGWYQVALRVYYDPATKPHPTGSITSPTLGAIFGENPSLTATAAGPSSIAQVDYFAHFDGYDPDGDGRFADWQVSYHRNGTSPYTMADHVGSATVAPYSVVWNTDLVPDQKARAVRLIAHVRDTDGYTYVTNPVDDLTLLRTTSSVRLYRSADVPSVYWVRNNQIKSNTIYIPPGEPLADVASASLLVRSWNARQAQTTTAVNAWIAPLYGLDHYYAYDKLPMPGSALVPGVNTFTVSSTDTEHHGTEILWPGPALLVRYNVPPRAATQLPALLGFDEADGQEAFDLTGNGNDGAIVVGATRTTSGRFGGAVQFDGSNGHVDLGVLDLPETGFTVSLWTWVDATSRTDARLFAKAIGGLQVDGHASIALDNRTGIRFRLQTSTGPTDLVASNVLTTNAWSHVAVTYDGAAMRIVVNGVQRASTAKTGAVLNGANIPVWLGDNPGASRRTLTGRIDELRLYPVAQTVAQVAADMTVSVTASDAMAPTIPENLVASLTSENTASVTWLPSTDDTGIAGYRVYRNGVWVATPTTTNYVDTELAPQTTFTYTVSAIDPSGNQSGLSLSAEIQTPADTQPPAAPLGLFAIPLNVVSIKLSWLPSSDPSGIDFYRILRDGALVATTSLATHTDTGLTGGTTYVYAVQAVDRAGNVSEASATADATTPPGTGAEASLQLGMGFEEEDGATAYDVSNSVNHGTLTDGVLRTAGGRHGRALDFAGAGAMVQLGVLDIPGSAMTIAAWVKADSFAITDARIISKASGVNDADHYWMISTISSSGIKPRFRLKTANGGTATLIGTTTLATGVWTHLAATYDGATMRLFVNGQPAGSLAKTGAISKSASVSAAIGNQPQGARAFDGLIDEVRLYTRALDAAELLEVMGQPLVPEDTAPTISAINDLTLLEGSTAGPLPFTIADAESAPENLLVTAVSSNAALVAPAGILIEGTGAERTITITPESGVFGVTTLTVTVDDGELSTSTAFRLSVAPLNNTAPTISTLNNLAAEEDFAAGPVGFIVGDAESPVESLIVTAVSNNPALLDQTGIALGNYGAEQTLTLTPLPNQSGSALITLTVSDGFLSTASQFTLTVAAANDQPVISPIAAQTVAQDGIAGPIAFTVGDVETGPISLVVSVSSSNTTVLPLSGITLGGFGSDRSVTLTPAAGQTGTATVTLEVSDGELPASTTFTLTVQEVVADPTLFLGLPFEEQSGDTALDVSSGARHGTLAGGTLRTDEGRHGRALDFASAGAMVQLGNLDIPGSAMTLAAWVKADSFAITDARILSKASGVNEQDHTWMISTITSSGIKPRFRLKTANGGTATLIGTTTLATGVWTHLAATYDGATMRLFVNGQPAGSLAKTGAISQSASVPAAIGNQPQGARAFDGLIDEVRLYTRALDQAELGEIMEAPLVFNPPPPDLTAPTAPTDLAATALSTTSVTLTWTPSTDNVGVALYRIFRDGSEAGTETDATYTDTGLAPGTEYAYTVLARDAAGNESPASIPALVTTPAPDTQAPSAPPSVTATATSASTVSVSWTAATDNIGVVLYRVLRGGVEAGTSTGTTYADSGLTPETSYVYTIRALDAAGNESAASPEAPVTTPEPLNGWWNTTWAFRLPITVAAAGTERVDHIVDIPLDLTGSLSAAGFAAGIDLAALRVIEVDLNETIIDEAVPFQFDADPDFDPASQATGTLVLRLTGTTPASVTRTYHLYIPAAGSGATPPPVPAEIVTTDDVMDEGQLSVRVQTATGTLFYHKQGAGFSSWVDADGNDWINHKPTGGSAGSYRGIPNLAYPAGHFHPGATTSTSTILWSGPLKTTIHSQTNDGLWESMWEIFPRFARLTVLRAPQAYWFLYEGTPGGTLEPNSDMIVRSNGVTTLASQAWTGDLTGEEWVYVADQATQRSAYFVMHEPDTAVDSYRQMENNMTVLGFGRDGLGTLLSGTPRHFTMGLVDTTAFMPMTAAIQSAYHEVGVTVLAAQVDLNSPDTEAPSAPVGLAAGPAGDSVALSWTASTDNSGFVFYRIHRDGTLVGVSPGTSFTDSGLTPNSSFTYTVRAVDAAGNESADSAAIIVDTPEPNTAPTISAISPQSTVMGATIGPIPFSVADAETDAGDLTLAATSSNPLLVPVSGVSFGGSGANRTVTIAPAAGQTGSTTIEITVSDGLLAATTSFVVNVVATTTLVSDDFSGGPLNTGLWTFVNPLGDATAEVVDNVLHIQVPAGTAHDLWTGNKNAPRVMQAVNDADFEVEAKFESTVSQTFQMQGIIIEQDAGNYLRFDTFWDGGSVRIFAASVINGKATARINQVVAPSTVHFLRVARAGNSWTFQHSTDGTTWTMAGSFSHTAVITQAGVFAGNAGGSSSPAHTARVDFVFDTADPIVPEDAPTNSVSVAIMGNGSVTRSPDLQTYEIGADVELTATPALGWLFDSWSGAVIGSTNPATLEISGPHAVTALFVPEANTAPTISAIADRSVTMNTSTGPISVTVDDAHTTPAQLLLSASSSNTALVPVSAITLGGSGANRTVSLTPAAGQTGTAAITVTASDGQLTANTTFVLTVLAPPDAAVSDDFSQGLNANLWTFVDPVGDATVEVVSDVLRIHVPGGLAHDLWTGAKDAPRLMQAVGNTDFEIEAKFESTVNQAFQMQGFVVEQDEANYLRFDVYSDGSVVRAFAASTVNNVAAARVTQLISPGPAYFLRVGRAGTLWTFSYSYDGESWTVAGSFNHAITVSGVGVFAANAWGASSPAFTTHVDYFFNTASPIDPEDGGARAINVTTVGQGTVLLSPEAETYVPGTLVQATAVPASGWLFEGWSGLLTGLENPQTLTVGMDNQLTATFIPENNTAPTISAIADQTTGSGIATSPIPFVVGDAESSPGLLAVSASSSNPILVPQAGITIQGTGANRTITVAPASGQSGSAEITVSVDDGLLSAIETFTITVNPLIGAFASDDFSSGSIDPERWTFVNPTGNATATVVANELQISIPGGSAQDMWGTSRNAARLMQPVDNTNFELMAKFTSAGTGATKTQGFLIEQDAQSYLRFDVFSTATGMKVFAAGFSGGALVQQKSSGVGLASEYFLNIRRDGGTWYCHYSFDNITWFYAFSIQTALNVQSVGVFAGNAGAPAPGFTSTIDFVVNRASSIVPEDAGGGQVTLSTSGQGTATAGPSQPQYAIGEYVELSATPAAGWHFTGWSGDHTGRTNPALIRIAGSHAIVANFAPNENGSLFHIWDGPNQSFGDIGKPQIWANLMGNIGNAGQLTSLSYTLNGAPQGALSVGLANPRLARTGDFNLELDHDLLLEGPNTVELTAQWAGGSQESKTVTFQATQANLWPLPYSVDWSTNPAVNEAVQVVDGKWYRDGIGLRTAEPGYDRLLAIGDISWQDYEIEVPFIVHRINGPASNPSGIGVLMRWSGHVESNNTQPRLGWFPNGAIGWFRWADSSGGPYLEIDENGHTDHTRNANMQVALGVEYVLKMRVTTLASAPTPSYLYQLKVWPAASAEPVGWTVQHTAETGLPAGSVLLIAHFADVTFGDIIISE